MDEATTSVNLEIRMPSELKDPLRLVSITGLLSQLMRPNNSQDCKLFDSHIKVLAYLERQSISLKWPW